MAKTSTASPTDLREFFSASEARIDRWRTLNRVAKALAAGTRGTAGAGDDPHALLGELAPLEELCGYPGPRLMAQVHDRLRTGDWTGFARLVQRISSALLSNSYRDEPDAWRIARMFSKTRLVSARTSPRSKPPVPGLIGPCPDTKMKSPSTIACE